MVGFVLFKECNIFRNKVQKFQFLPKIKNIWLLLFLAPSLQDIKTAFQPHHLWLNLRSPEYPIEPYMRKHIRWPFNKLSRAKMHVVLLFMGSQGTFYMVMKWIKNSLSSLKNLKNTYYPSLFFKEL